MSRSFGVAGMFLLATMGWSQSDLRFGIFGAWPADLRLQIRAPLNPSTMVQTELGTSLFSLEGAFVLGGAFLFDHHLGDWGAWRFGVAAGIPDAILVITDNTPWTLSLGAGVTTRYSFALFRFYGRLGGGIPWIWSGKQLRWGSSQGVFWPDLVVGLEF